MTHKLITPPAIEPITLAEVKAHLAICHQEEDDELTLLAISARDMAETYTGRAFIAQRLLSETGLEMEHAPGRALVSLPHKIIPGRVAFRLTRSPLLKVEQIQVVESNGIVHDIPSQKWHVNMARDPAMIVIDHWARVESRLKITYEAGYGHRREDVPAGLRQALLMLTAFLYKNRAAPSKTCLAQFDPYRIRRVI